MTDPEIENTLVKRKLEAIQKLGDLRDERAVPTLLAVLNDTVFGVKRLQAANKPVLRQEAAQALAKIGGAGAETTLSGLLNHPDAGERQLAADALASGAGSAAIAALLDRLKKEKDPAVKFKIITSLGKVGGAAGSAAERAVVAGELIALMQNSVGDIKLASITALGHLKLDTATAPLLKELRSWMSIAPLVEAIVRALGEIGDPTAVDDLSLMLASHRSVAAREQAAVALGAIGDAKALAALRKALTTEKSPAVRAIISKFVP